MTKYINKADVVAEIEKRRMEWLYGSSIEAKYKKEECDDILSFLNTLEVKEVDLDKEARHYLLHEHESILSTILHQMEFDTPVNSSSTEEQHWHDVRECAAIAAMQGILCSPIVEGVDPNPSQKRVAEMAVMQADLLVEELKKKGE